MNIGKIFFVILLLISIEKNVFAGFGGTSNQIARAVSQNISKNLFERMIPKLKIKNSSGKVNQMSVSNTGKYLTLSLEDETARVWDLEYGVQRPFVKSETKILANGLDEKQGLIYILQESGLIGYDILTAKKETELNLKSFKNPSDFFLISNENKVLLSNGSSLSLFGFESKNKEWTQNQFEGELKKTIADDVSGKWISLVRKSSLFSSNDWLEVGDLSSGKKQFKLENSGNSIVFFGLPDEQKRVRVGYENGTIIDWDLNTGTKGIELRLEGKDIKLMDISSDGKIVYLNDDDQLVVTDMTQKNRSTLDMKDKDIKQLALMNGGRTVATADEQGEILFWAIATGNDFLQLISTKEGWTVVDKTGRFDSSEKGMVNVSWQVTETEIPLDSFSKNHYEPGLLASHLKERAFINATPANVLEGITLPPIVEIVEPTLNSQQRSGNESVMLHVIGQGLGGGLEEIFLYHNGKKNNVGTLASKKTKGKQGVSQEINFKVTLSIGKNIFRAVAVNSIGVEGKSKEFVVHVSGDVAPPTIHVLSVGINEYSDPRLNLDYSVADADAIAKIILDQNLKKYGKVKHHSLNNKQATKANILNYLGNLKDISQDDVLVVYAAGHGIAIDKKWYFLPYETVLQKNHNEYAKVGVSAKEFKDVLAINKAQKVFVIIDSCFSSAGLDAFRDLQNTQRHFSRDLSKSVGVVVLTAARFDQKADERSELGHGLFTYVVMRGMGGLADRNPRNKKISAHEIAEFTVDMTPSFSKKYIEASQEPSAFVIGSDFELLQKIN